MNEITVTKVYAQIKQAIEAKDEHGKKKYKYIVLEGSSRSSKTQSTIQVIHEYCSTKIGKRTSVWRDTRKDCVTTVGYDVFKIFKELPNYQFINHTKTSDYTKIDNYRFWTESVFELTGSDDEDKVIGFQGDLAWLNEPYKIGKETFKQIDMRTSDLIIIDWNPKQSHWIEDLKKDPRCITIHSTFKDNPFCPEEQKIKILGYQPVSMCDSVLSKTLSEQEAFDYDLSLNEKDLSNKQLNELTRCLLNEEKNSASEFDWKVYGLGLKAEKPNKIFSGWNKITKQEFYKIDAEKYYGVDWGKVDPFGIIELKYYDGAIYINELNYLSENEIRSKLSIDKLSELQYDDEGLVTYWFEKLGIDKDRYVICDNNRPAKVLQLVDSGYENAFSAPKGKGSIKDGIDLIDSVNVFYTETSKNLEYEYENYSWKTDRYGLTLEEPVDADNHTIDPIRYIMLYLRNMGILNKI